MTFLEMSKKENTCAPFSEAGEKWTDSNNSKPRSDREKVPAGRGGDGVLGLQNAPPRKPRLPAVMETRPCGGQKATPRHTRSASRPSLCA